jgi:hypothetical protein
MLAAERLLASRARSLVSAIGRAYDEKDAIGFALLAAGMETGKNGIIAFGRALHPVLLTAGAVDIALTLAGDPSADTLRLACIYLRDNADAVCAIAASDPQLNAWVNWLISRIRRFPS